MANNTKDVLNNLSEEEYGKLKEAGKNKLLQLCSGEIVIDRKKDYLFSIKKEIQKAIKLGYSFAEIAKVIRDEEKGIVFSAKQIRDFCSENGINKADKKSTKKSKGENSQSQSQTDTIPTGNRNRPKAEA